MDITKTLITTIICYSVVIIAKDYHRAKVAIEAAKNHTDFKG